MAHSLDRNALCGIMYDDEHNEMGAYTAEGINKLCEALKVSSVTSLRCVLTDSF